MAIVDLRDRTEDFTANPYPYYEKLREAGPVHHVRTADVDEMWLVVGYEEGRKALADPRLSKNWRNSELWDPEQATAMSSNMLETDPPHHTRLRKLVAREFTARRVEAMRPRVQQIADDLVNSMTAKGSSATGAADLIDALAFPLPMTVICELLGVPDLDRDRFRAWSNEVVAPTGTEASAAAVSEMGGYLVELIEEKRRAPGEDLMSALIKARDEDGDQLSPDELVGMAFLLLVAGHETTVNLISNGVRALLDNPDQLAALRADFDGLIDGAVEEMLRYEGPVENATFRFTREDMELGGVVIPAGKPVLVSLASGDRDPDRYPEPDRFDIHRAPQGHLAFGHGIHFCLGAPLARMEGRIAIRTLLERCPDLALAADGGPVEWVPGLLIRGVRKLPVRW
ncbi:cytochrome P450 [Streptomyces sp. NBC_00237]|uniref:cytochrome P450 family protein n=1 Tax=Streptomyces sp. NBC_00237 TaxID=2975687 RepID=UPI0022549992|nr:cytochrome P450 [Streptomyces sp. NBC_00237]MCX5203272.1 cytochrome P450 [Streptomyces sp. NBC_00237]